MFIKVIMVYYTYLWVQTADIKNSEVRILEQFLAIQAFMDTSKSVLLLVEIDINGSGTRY